VLAAIIHFISSGKIKDAINKDNSQWNQAQIELWVNTVFTKEETPAETTDKTKSNESTEKGNEVPAESSESSSQPGEEIKATPEVEKKEEKSSEVVDPNPTVPAQESPETTPGAGQETVENAPSTKVEPEVVTKTTEEAQPGNNTDTKETKSVENGKIENKAGEGTAATEKEKSDGKAASTGNSVEIDVLDLSHLNGYIIPAEHKGYEGLYAKKSEVWHNAFTSLIQKMAAEGKSKKDIKHELADIMKAIAINDAITQTFCRNWYKTDVSQMYKMIEGKVAKLGIKEWDALKEE
jgi:hypothetical protein